MASHGKHSSTGSRISKGIGAFFLSVVGLIYRIVMGIAHFLAWLWRKSRVVLVVLIVVVVLIIGGIVDFASTNGKIYSGVSIGNVDVSNMTPQEAQDAVTDEYDKLLENANVIIFANDEVASTVDIDRYIVQYEALAEQMSFDEAQENKIIWMENSQTLGVWIPIDSLVEEAYEVGRGNSGISGRFSAQFNGKNIDVDLRFDNDTLDSLTDDINASIGTIRNDYNIEVTDGIATVVPGNTGYEMDSEWFSKQLSDALLKSGETDGKDPGTFVAEVVFAPLRIDEQKAQETCDAVNTLIANGATFDYGNTSLEISRETVGSWISTDVEKVSEDKENSDDNNQKNNGDETDATQNENSSNDYILAPHIDATLATPSLVSQINENLTGKQIEVSIEVNDDEITVTPNEEVDVPLLKNSLDEFDEELFGDYRKGDQNVESRNYEYSVETGKVSGPLSFDEAYSYGLISTVSSFTTEFVNTTSTENRAHNIQLAADLLNNSVASANGGQWSFNNIAGNCDDEAGFLDAGAIAGGEYVEEAGGGICQVATTVFNAVFEAGYAVVERSNHSLYVSSYPAGRDAAIAYPELDLIWRNDTGSYVLLCTSYTDTSITVTLYGVDPDYRVTSETGDWLPGASYSTITEVDESLEPGESYIKTAGTDGMEITVTRTVYDKDGSELYEDVFNSTYSPVDEVIVTGP